MLGPLLRRVVRMEAVHGSSETERIARMSIEQLRAFLSTHEDVDAATAQAVRERLQRCSTSELYYLEYGPNWREHLRLPHEESHELA